MAGKFGPICTEFPLATISAKILTNLPFEFPAKKIIKQHLVQNEIEANANLSSLGKNQNSLENSVPFLSFFFNFDSMMSSLDFF